MMKKVILLLILQLTVLMAADFTMSKSGTLTKEGATAPPATQEVVTPPATEPVAETTPTPTPTPVVGGIIPTTTDIIWEDNNGANTGYPSQMTSGYPQFVGPVHRSMPPAGSRVNAWYEMAEMGDGSSCGPSINQSKYTRVEVGRIRAWILKSDGTWYKFNDSNLLTGVMGTRRPTSSDPIPDTSFGSCGNNTIYTQTRSLHSDYDPKADAVLTPDGFKAFKPYYYWYWHGWGNAIYTVPAGAKAIYVQAYMRLIVDTKNNPNGIDDRHLAKFVNHISGDYKNSSGITLGDYGMSRWKKITNNWESQNFLTGMTKAELEANPPPFSLVP